MAPTIGHNGLQRRDSMQQPLHRRPFYGKSEQSFNTYMSPSTRPAYVTHQGIDNNMDNFSYDPDHLAQYAMPKALSDILPKELKCQSELWQLSAAALCTILERIKDFEKKAMSYAYPESDHPVKVAATAGRMANLVRGDYDTSTVLSSHDPNSSPPMLPHAPGQLEQLLMMQSQHHTPSELGMDSPPMTPVDSVTSGTPMTSFEKFQSGPITRNHSFDEISWETFVRACTAQHDDLKQTWSRLKGCGRKINILVHEQDTRTVDKENTRALLKEFMKWWGPMERFEVSNLEKRVQEVDPPKLEDVRIDHQVQKHFANGGLPGRVFSLDM